MESVRFWKPSLGVMVLWPVWTALVAVWAVAPALRMDPRAAVPLILAIGLAVAPVGMVLHEAAHLAACRILGLPARFADRWGILPRSVAFSGAAPWWAYAIIVAAPAVPGLLALLAGPSDSLWRIVPGLIGAVALIGAPDDAARVLFLLIHRPALVEESPDGHMFRPAGEAGWISVNPRHLPPRGRRILIAAGMGIAAACGLLLPAILMPT
ncbi:MAG: hypothetical protein QN194_15530 [Armatimonadota bacterium]|nr:hypothetical protein [Armatimonadota bacterium]